MFQGTEVGQDVFTEVGYKTRGMDIFLEEKRGKLIILHFIDSKPTLNNTNAYLDQFKNRQFAPCEGTTFNYFDE